MEQKDEGCRWDPCPMDTAPVEGFAPVLSPRCWAQLRGGRMKKVI